MKSDEEVSVKKVWLLIPGLIVGAGAGVAAGLIAGLFFPAEKRASLSLPLEAKIGPFVEQLPEG